MVKGPTWRVCRLPPKSASAGLPPVRRAAFDSTWFVAPEPIGDDGGGHDRPQPGRSTRHSSGEDQRGATGGICTGERMASERLEPLHRRGRSPGRSGGRPRRPCGSAPDAIDEAAPALKIEASRIASPDFPGCAGGVDCQEIEVGARAAPERLPPPAAAPSNSASRPSRRRPSPERARSHRDYQVAPEQPRRARGQRRHAATPPRTRAAAPKFLVRPADEGRRDSPYAGREIS